MKTAFIFLFLISVSLPSGVFAADSKASVSDAKDAVKKSISDISFDKGFLGKVNEKVTDWTAGIEVWRVKEKGVFQTSLDVVDKKRSQDKDPKTPVKVFRFLHILVLATLLFIFSLQFVFYAAFICIGIWLIRKIILFLVGIFRRNRMNA